MKRVKVDTPIWNWSRNADCVMLPLGSSHVRGTSLTQIMGEALFMMDSRLSVQSQMFLMDAGEGLALSTARVGLTAGDGMLDINVVMDIRPTRKTPADPIEYFIEYRFAGEFHSRLTLDPGKAPITEWRLYSDTHAAITKMLVDQVLDSRLSWISTSPGAVVGSVIGTTASMHSHGRPGVPW